MAVAAAHDAARPSSRRRRRQNASSDGGRADLARASHEAMERVTRVGRRLPCQSADRPAAQGRCAARAPGGRRAVRQLPPGAGGEGRARRDPGVQQRSSSALVDAGAGPPLRRAHDRRTSSPTKRHTSIVKRSSRRRDERWKPRARSTPSSSGACSCRSARSASTPASVGAWSACAMNSSPDPAQADPLEAQTGRDHIDPQGSNPAVRRRDRPLEVGSVLQVGDGIARVHGLENCVALERLEFEHRVDGHRLQPRGRQRRRGALRRVAARHRGPAGPPHRTRS